MPLTSRMVTVNIASQPNETSGEDHKKSEESAERTSDEKSEGTQGGQQCQIGSSVQQKLVITDLVDKDFAFMRTIFMVSNHRNSF
jgi:hypothetical protein